MRPPTAACAAATLALAASCALASRSPFAAPPAAAGFVPVLNDGSTLWAHLSALRRSAFPMIAQNQPERTLFVDAAVDLRRCGITPPLKGLGYEEGTCWPGAFAWLWGSEWDRTTYILALHSTNVRASTRDVFDAGPQRALYLASGAPWETLLARSEARLRWVPRTRAFTLEADMWVDSTPKWATASSPQVRRYGSLPLRQRRMEATLAVGPSGHGSESRVSAEGGAAVSAPSLLHAAAAAGVSGDQHEALGAHPEDGAHAAHLDSPGDDAGEDGVTRGPVGTSRRLHDGWNATSDRLFEDGHRQFSLFGAQFELTDGMIRSSTEPRAVYPRLTALSYVFASPVHVAWAALVNASCWCPDPALAGCPLSYLCFILDRAVFTWLLPTDAAFTHLTCGARDYILERPDVAAAVIGYQMLGQVVFVCPLQGPLRCSTPIVARRLMELAPTGAEGRALSVRVNARLLQLRNAMPPTRAASDVPAAEHSSGAPVAAATARADDALAAPSARPSSASPGAAPHRQLGFLGGAAGDLPNLPRHVDDAVLWTTVPFLAPWPSWMLHEQLGDVARNTDVFVAQAFHPLLASNLTNTSFTLDPAALLNASDAFPGPVLSSFVPFTPAELLLSYGAAYPCRGACGACQACRDRCDHCRDWAGLQPYNWRRLQAAAGGNVSGGGGGGGGTPAGSDPTVAGASGGACTDACACYTPCFDCDCCRADNAGRFPGPLRRMQQEEKEEDAAPTVVGHGAAAAASRAHAQAAAQCEGCELGASYGTPLTFTCLDTACGVTDWACEARTLPPYVDVETLNAVLHFTDNVLLPPDVLWALWANGTRPYTSSPPLCKFSQAGGCALTVPADCPFLPSGGGANATLLSLGLGGVFALIGAHAQPW